MPSMPGESELERMFGGQEPRKHKVNDGVDYSRSILWQVGSLPDYYTWVQRPVMYPSFRLFDNDFLETFSRTQWWVVPLVWIPVAVYWACMSMACGDQGEGHLNGNQASNTTLTRDLHDSVVMDVPCHSPGLQPHTAMLCWCLGLLSWSLIEYILHRLLFHGLFAALGPTVHFFFHGQHHKFPKDKGRLVFPPVPAAGITFAIFSLFRVFMSLPTTYAVASGALVGYIAYDLTHYSLHHGPRWFPALRKSHMEHHFIKETKGVTG